MWWRDWHPTKSAHQSVQITISAHQILSHHLVQIPISIYNAEDMIYNSDTDTSFLEFQSRVRDTFLRYATKWKFVIIDAKQEKAQMLSELVQQLKKVYK